MVILKKGKNTIKLTVGHLNGDDNYIFHIQEAFGQYKADIEVEELSPNRNLISKFEFDIVENSEEQDLPNKKLYLRKGQRYYYKLRTLSGDIIDSGYAKFK